MRAGRPWHVREKQVNGDCFREEDGRSEDRRKGRLAFHCGLPVLMHFFQVSLLVGKIFVFEKKSSYLSLSSIHTFLHYLINISGSSRRDYGSKLEDPPLQRRKKPLFKRLCLKTCTDP